MNNNTDGTCEVCGYNEYTDTHYCPEWPGITLFGWVLSEPHPAVIKAICRGCRHHNRFVPGTFQIISTRFAWQRRNND